MNDPIIVYLANKRDQWHTGVGVSRFSCLLASIKTVKLFLPPMPILVFNEDLTTEDKAEIWNVLPDVVFELIDFGGQEAHYVNKRPESHVGAYGYCMMCRFFSGIMQSHPLVTEHSHYMRLDDDNYFVAPVPNNMLTTALVRDYTYSAHFDEDRKELYQFTLDFMRRESLPHKHVPKYTNGESPYNNFHIASRTLWQNPTVAKYLTAIEEVHGCLAEGWTDSSIQYMIIRLLAPAIGLSINFDQNISYRHNQHCRHPGPHTKYCVDGKNVQFPWGPPICLE